MKQDKKQRDLYYKIADLYPMTDLPVDEFAFRRKLLADVKGNIALFCATCALYGELEALEAAYAVYGPFPIEYSLNYSRHSINGDPFQVSFGSKRFLSGIKNPQELSRLLEIIPEMGLGFLTGVDSEHSLMWDTDGLGSHRLFKPGFDGDFPVMSADRTTLSDPELMLALLDKRDQSHFPKAYDEILCWIPDSVVHVEPKSWEAYCSKQEVILNKVDSETSLYSWSTVTTPLRDLTETDVEEIFKQHPNTGCECLFRGLNLKTESVTKRLFPMNGFLMSELGGTLLNHGFGFKEGHTLCRVNVSDLQDMELASVNDQALADAQMFAKDYVPLGIISFLYEKDNNINALGFSDHKGLTLEGVNRATNTLEVDNLLSMLSENNALGKAIMATVNTSILRNMAMHNRPVLGFKSMMFAVNTLGLDTSAFSASIREDKITELLDQDIQFSKNTQVEIYGLELKRGSFVSGNRISIPRTSLTSHDVLQFIIDRGVRLINGHDLSDVRNSLVTISKNLLTKYTDGDKLVVHTARVKSEGLENCVRLAKTKSDWIGMEKVFGSDAVMPFIDKAPKLYRTHKLSSDLGL